ncbi:MAG: hypothetical protein WC712_03895 [Candidatus Brocadiia bacterium]
MSTFRRLMASATLLAAGISILIFPTGCARRSVTQNTGSGTGRDVLISGLPVALDSDKWAVNADETAYAVGGESGIVVELSLPSCQYKSMWKLGEPIQAIFSDGDRYVAVVPSGIYSLRGAEKKRIGAIPQGDKLRLPPELSGTRRSCPLTCRDGKIMWYAYLEAEKVVILFSTDMEGKNPRGFKAGAVSFRVAPGAEWALALSLDAEKEWLVTPDGLVEVEKGGGFIALGHSGFALRFGDYRIEYSAAAEEFTRVEGSLRLPENSHWSCFVSTRGNFISEDSYVWRDAEGGPPVQTSLRFCQYDGENLYLIDKQNRSFVSANILADRIEITAAEGDPVYCDSRVQVTAKDFAFFVNGNRVAGKFYVEDFWRIGRAGRVLYFDGGGRVVLVDLDTLESEVMERAYAECNGRLLLVRWDRMDDPDHPNQDWIAVNPAEPSDRLVVDLHGECPGGMMVLSDRILAHEDTFLISFSYGAFEFDADFSAKRAIIREVPKGVLLPIGGGYVLDIWSESQTLFYRNGRAVPLPPISLRRSFVGIIGDGELYSQTIVRDGSLYVRCGCNFVRVWEQ